MIFIDTWIWLEFLGESSGMASDVVAMPDKITSTAALLEVKYHSSKRFSHENAEKIIYLIENDHSTTILPLNIHIAKLAANLKLKYYDKKNRPISFIDCINLATAISSGCDKFYTGDPDFDGISEIEIKNIRQQIPSDRKNAKEK